MSIMPSDMTDAERAKHKRALAVENGTHVALIVSWFLMMLVAVASVGALAWLPHSQLHLAVANSVCLHGTVGAAAVLALRRRVRVEDSIRAAWRERNGVS